jgi:hypothetical protein
VGVPAYFDLFDARRVQGKSSLHTDAVGRDTPHSKTCVGASTFADAQDGTTHQLDPLSITLDDAKVNLYVIASSQAGQIRFQPDVFFLLLLFN